VPNKKNKWDEISLKDGWLKSIKINENAVKIDKILAVLFWNPLSCGVYSTHSAWSFWSEMIWNFEKRLKSNFDSTSSPNDFVLHVICKNYSYNICSRDFGVVVPLLDLDWTMESKRKRSVHYQRKSWEREILN